MEMDKGDMMGMVLLDFLKASDTPDHSVLIIKLKTNGLENDTSVD